MIYIHTIRSHFFCAVLALLLVCFTSLTLAHAQDKPVKIGVLFPISNNGAFYGLPAVLGVKLAVEEANRNKGVFDMPVEYVVRDTMLNPSAASAAARELILNEDVDLIIGAVSSAVALAVSEVAKQEKVVFITPIAKSVDITQKNGHPYVFMTSSNTDIEGKQLAEVTKEQGAKRVCFTGYDYAYSHSLYKTFVANLDPSISIEGTYYVNLGTTDYNGLISRLLIAPCDTIVGVIWGGGYITFVKQARVFSLLQNKQLIWGAEVGSHEIVSSLKSLYPEGQMSNAYSVWNYKGGRQYTKFQRILAEEQGRQFTDSTPITSFIATDFALQALRNAQSTNSEKLIEALEGLYHETPLGTRFFNDQHEMNSGEIWGEMFLPEAAEYARMRDPQYRYVLQ